MSAEEPQETEQGEDFEPPPHFVDWQTYRELREFLQTEFDLYSSEAEDTLEEMLEIMGLKFAKD